MKSFRSEIERIIPTLRQVARALAEGDRPEAGDEMVHDAVSTVLRQDQPLQAEQVAGRLYARLIAANRVRLRQGLGERRSAPGSLSRGEGGQRALGYGTPAGGPASHGLDALSASDREALLLVVLARLDYSQAAEVLGVPLAILLARLTHARETLGTALWAGEAAALPRRDASAPRPGWASHLRLVKS